MREITRMRQGVQVGGMIAAVVGLVTIILFTLANALSVAPILPLRQMWERRFWEQRQPQHYELDVAWSSGARGGMVRQEVRGGQIIRSLDLNTGQSPAPKLVIGASDVGSINGLFDLIDALNGPVWRLDTVLARAHPQLARWLNPCVTPAPQVHYDAVWGYPSTIRWAAGSCAPGINLAVQVSQLRRLP